MRKMKHIWILILMINGNTYGQQSLTVGDQLPDFVIPKVINSDLPFVSTKDFRNQLLIIDFWSVYCSGCVVALPKMEALQKQFGNKIKILPVTNEAEDLVMAFWKKNKNTKNLNLSSVVEDKIFDSYFKHRGVPHEVWIFNGKVIGITAAEYVDEHNIRKVLESQPINWPVKDDFYTFDGTKQALFQADENQIDLKTTSIIYAAISDYKEGVNAVGLTGGSGIVRDAKQKTIRTFFLNQPIYTSYFLNWGKIVKPESLNKPSAFGIGPNEIIWESVDPSRYMYHPNSGYLAEWIRKNGICFESQYPDTGQTDQQVYASIIADLNRLLGLNVRWEKRTEKVLLLTRNNQHINLSSKPISKETEEHFSVHGDIQRFRDVPLSTLVFKLNQEEQNPYVFDKTGFTGNVDLDFQLSSWTHIAAVRKALARYGLDLKEEERLVDKFVFTEINGGLLYQKKINN
jgi:thiol-disulfide isomerase/thioredoxin